MANATVRRARHRPTSGTSWSMGPAMWARVALLREGRFVRVASVESAARRGRGFVAEGVTPGGRTGWRARVDPARRTRGPIAAPPNHRGPASAAGLRRHRRPEGGNVDALRPHRVPPLGGRGAA